jgi:hypothetical protein
VEKLWIGGILLAIILGSIALATATTNETCPACSTNPDANKENKKLTELKLPEELTKEDLQKLYRKYGIKENDIKFAKGELPHFLKGTLLDGKVVIMGKVTEGGKVESWIDPLFYKWCIKNSYKL